MSSTTYKVLLTEEAAEFVRSLDEKSQRICRDNLRKLEHPYPGQGIGDKEKLPVRGEKRYRLHIGRTTLRFMRSLRMNDKFV